MYFQIRPCIAKHLSFLSRVRLRCHHSQNNVCWKLVTLLFIRLGNWHKGWYSLQTESWFLLKEICITMSLSPPPRWRMVTSDCTQDSWSTALLPHHQPIKEGHKPCNPHPKCCLLFPGTRDDHPVRSPVWFLSISSLRGANEIAVTARVEAGFRCGTPQLRSGRERLLLY